MRVEAGTLLESPTPVPLPCFQLEVGTFAVLAGADHSGKRKKPEAKVRCATLPSLLKREGSMPAFVQPSVRVWGFWKEKRPGYPLHIYTQVYVSHKTPGQASTVAHTHLDVPELCTHADTHRCVHAARKHCCLRWSMPPTVSKTSY